MSFPTSNKTPNFPVPLDKRDNKNGNTLVFPSDLLGRSKKGNKGNFCTHIELVDYDISMQNPLGNYIVNPKNGIKLPIPIKLNDALLLNWSSISLTDALLGGAQSGAAAIDNYRNTGSNPVSTTFSGISLLAQAGGIYKGVALNPLMFMQFQRPEYRQFSLSWILTPKNSKESDSIKEIILSFKRAASPTRALGGFLMGYPQIAMIKMKPDDVFGLLKFKPCIIQSVQVSYTGGPTPAFYKDGAPAVVNLTLNLQEMQFWFREEI